MRTSQLQFELMVTYMEQHGDITKPSSNARGRISSIMAWENLTTLLNSDGGGDIKPAEKWKKVWSDLKNNVKKKAAKLHRAACGTGGGPAMQAKLSDIELRILNIVGVQMATGLSVPEAGLLEVRHPEIERTQLWSEAGPSTQPHVSVPACPSPPPPPPPIASPPHSFIETPIENPAMLSPSRPGNMQHRPAQSGLTTPQRITQSRRRLRLTHTEQASQYFLNADERWRRFKERRHKEEMQVQENQQQINKQWLELGTRAINLLEQLVNKVYRDTT